MNVQVPREDANDDTATLQRWLVEDGQQVESGQVICQLETTKTVFDVHAPAAGPLHRLAREGQELPVGGLLARIGEPTEDRPAPPQSAVRLTREAERYVNEHQIDLSQARFRGIATLDDVKALGGPLGGNRASDGLPRVLLVGGGSVGMQVLDILLHDPFLQPVGLLDDDPNLTDRFGVRILGRLSDLESLFRDQVFDKAIITLGLNLSLKRRYFELCQELGIPLANAIDPSARINRGTVLGQGNVLCSFVHLGVATRLGDNNFVAAHSSIDHHNVIGSHSLFGPGCLLSGRVRVGDECLFGSGVIVQPNLSIGSNSKIASGSVILRDIQDNESVRLHL